LYLRSTYDAGVAHTRKLRKQRFVGAAQLEHGSNARESVHIESRKSLQPNGLGKSGLDLQLRRCRLKITVEDRTHSADGQGTCSRLVALGGHLREFVPHALRGLPVTIAEKRPPSPRKAMRQVSGSHPTMRIGHEFGSQRRHRISVR